MARAFTATLPDATLPPRKLLQTAIDALGFKCKLDADYSPDFQGYLACDLDGEDAGFTLKTSGADAAVVTLSWGGDPREEAAARIVCAALAEYFGARIARDATEQMAGDLVKAAKKALA
jgi:hypothetical protein